MNDDSPIDKTMDGSAASASPIRSPDLLHSSAKPGISHLLIYVTCVVVIIAVDRNQLPFEEIGPHIVFSRSSGFGIERLLQSMIAGVAVAATAILFCRWLIRSTLPSQPGEWILVASGIAWCTSAFVSLVLSPPKNDALTWSSAQAMVPICGALVLAVGALRLRREMRWSICLASWSIGSLVASLMLIVPVALMLGASNKSIGMGIVFALAASAAVIAASVTALLTFCISVVLDIFHRVPRDWMHWLGVGFTVVTVLARTIVGWLQ